jgi:hypothetical protein
MGMGFNAEPVLNQGKMRVVFAKELGQVAIVFEGDNQTPLGVRQLWGLCLPRNRWRAIGSQMLVSETTTSLIRTPNHISIARVAAA